MEDDERLRTALARLLRSARFQVDVFESAEAFLTTTARHDCLILDVQLPGQSGIELAERLEADGDRTPIVFLTGSGADLVHEVKRRTGRTCLPKPVDEAVLLMAVVTALVRG